MTAAERRLSSAVMIDSGTETRALAPSRRAESGVSGQGQTLLIAAGLSSTVRPKPSCIRPVTSRLARSQRGSVRSVIGSFLSRFGDRASRGRAAGHLPGTGAQAVQLV